MQLVAMEIHANSKMKCISSYQIDNYVFVGDLQAVVLLQTCIFANLQLALVGKYIKHTNRKIK